MGTVMFQSAIGSPCGYIYGLFYCCSWALFGTPYGLVIVFAGPLPGSTQRLLRHVAEPCGRLQPKHTLKLVVLDLLRIRRQRGRLGDPQRVTIVVQQRPGLPMPPRPRGAKHGADA